MKAKLSAWMGAFVAATLVVAQVQAQYNNTQPTDQQQDYQNSSYPETFYPGTEVRALPAARANAVVARAQLRQAQSDLDNAVRDISRAYDNSDDVKAAQAEQATAFDQLKQARETALAQLKNDSTYQNMLAMRDRLSQQIENRQAEKGVTAEDLLPLAWVKLSYTATITAMEASAMSTQPQVDQARQRLVASGNRLSELREKYDQAVRSDTQVLAARKAVADLRIAALGADALYIESLNVANYATDFAYHVYDNQPPYVVNTPYYYGGGYGSGYTIGYPIGYPYGSRINRSSRVNGARR